jgi:hypothetical protein
MTRQNCVSLPALPLGCLTESRPADDPSEHARDIVARYWDSVPKTSAVKKRKSGVSSSPAPRSAAASKKNKTGGRKSASFNGNGNGNEAIKAEDKVDDEGPDFATTHVDSMDKYMNVRDWEALVESVDTIERSADGELAVFMTM